MIFASIAAPARPVVVFRSSCSNGQAAEVRSYAALTGLVAAIPSHCHTCPVAVVRSHFARHLTVHVCMYVCKYIHMHES
jgi:hypothetical protein